MELRDFRRIWLIVIVLAGFLLAINPLSGQGMSELAIEKRLEMVKNGRADEVKAELPSLLTKYQHHPGVLYLQGVLTSDGTEAVKVFQSIVDNFPKSEWADDALYRVYQYYYSLGFYKTAIQKHDQLKRDYPNSPYLAQAVSHGVPRAPEETEKIQAQAGSEERAFAVQVGAFSTAENANKQRRMLQSAKYPVEILNKVRNGKSYYLVWIGNFNSREAAQKFRSELESRYKIEAMVVER